ncbi:uncharacterized protein K444DRAFT_532164, partial [Hyaloscypha bicolor E]
DKKGFLIRVMRVIKRIISKEAYKSGRVKQAIHNRNREFITCLAYVSIIRKRVPVTLLYTSKSFNLRNTWRLLIINSYLSHINIIFINKY